MPFIVSMGIVWVIVLSHLGYGIIPLMNHPSSPDTAQAKKQHVPKLFLIITALFIILVVAGGYLFATKQLVFAFGSSEEKPVTVVASVCSKSTINKFNASYGAKTADERKAALTSAFEAVNATAGYASDPNCEYIRYVYYIEQKDVQNAQKEVDVLKALAAKNQYASSQVYGVRSIESMQSDVKVLTNPETKTNESSGGQG